MTDREEFEAWLRTPCPDDYKCDPKWAAYIWQAATEAALERAVEEVKRTDKENWFAGRCAFSKHAAEAIRALKEQQ
jgi:hypothetical protein